MPIRLCRCSSVRLLAAMLLILAGTASGIRALDDTRPKIVLCKSTWSFQVPNRAWCPVLTRVENPTDRAVVLNVNLGFQLGRQDTVKYLRRVWLPAYSERTVETFVVIDYPPRHLLRLFDEKQNELTFSDGTRLKTTTYKGKLLYFKANLANAKSAERYDPYEFQGYPVHPEAQFVVVVDGIKASETTDERYVYRGLPYTLGEHEKDCLFLGGGDPPLSDAFCIKNLPLMDDIGCPIKSTHTPIGSLPRKWAAYEGVDALIFGSLRRADGTRGLTPQQRHSLLRYIRSGGRVVVMPTHDLGDYQHPFWRQLLPVRLMDTRLLDDGLQGWEKTYGKPITLDHERPPLVAEALPGAGQVLAQDGQRVLLARRRVGSGEVWYVAATGGVLEDWSQGHSFWSKILAPRSNPVPGLHAGFAEDASSFLASVVGAEAPAPMTVILLLGGYCLLAVLALVVFRWRGRAELGWPVVMVLALIGLFAAFFISRAARARIGFVQGEMGVTVLHPGMARGGTTSYVGLFSPDQAKVELRWVSPDTLATGYPNWTQVGASGGLGKSLLVEESNNFTFPGLLLNPGEMLVARAMTMSRFGDGVELDVGYGPRGVTGHVVNRTGRPLTECILRLNRRTLRIGDLSKGETRDLSTCALTWSLAASDFAASDEVKVRRYVLAELLRVRTRPGSLHAKRAYSWPVAFYGWCDTPQARVDLGKAKPKERAVQLLVAPAETIRASGTIKVPAGACGLRLLRGGNRMAYGSSVPPTMIEDVQLPDKGMRIAGTRRRKPKRLQRHPTRTATRTAGEPRQHEQLDPQTRFKPMGWKPSSVSSRVRVGFDRPQGLEALKVSQVTLVVDVELRDFVAKVGVAKSGATTFQPIPGLKVGGGRVTKVFSGKKLEQLMGPGGELPTFELSIRPPPGQTMSTGGRWRIREFDVELEGTMPEAAR